jgi:Family of unknown function (DUF6279)
MPALLRAATLAVATLALAGCAMLGLVYNRLDTIVGFYIEDMVTLTPQQSAQLDDTLADNLAWHRGSELRRYAQFLREVAATFATPVDREQLVDVSRRSEDYWRDIFEQATPGYTALALSFSDAQVRELIDGFERRDEEEYREYAGRSEAERIQRREKQVRRLLERFTGPLNAQQRTLVADYARAVPEFMDEWRAMRVIWRDELEAALVQRRDTPQFRATMRQLIAYPDAYWPDAYRRRFDAGREGFLALLQQLDRTLTAEQRAATRRELLALAVEVEKLIRA